tara:strand:- start:134448 stop:135305 length:858 start_codon:yes stop_codon:yes gene_type:complete
MTVAVSRRVALAQEFRQDAAVELNDRVPREVREVTVVQNLGDSIPKDLPLTDSLGRATKSGHYFDGEKPTIVTLNYSNCPVLCSVQLNQLSQSLDQLELKIGEDFQLLTVSIDPKETTQRIRETKAKYIEQLPQHPNADEGWTFCTARQDAITRLADTLGFQYTYDEKSGEYYHPAMIAFVSPDGVITRYSLEVAFPPEQLKLALVEAGNGTVGTPVDQFILWCFSYDPNRNSYVPQAWKIMRLGGAATIGLMLVALTPYWIGRKKSPTGRDDAVAEPTDTESTT